MYQESTVVGNEHPGLKAVIHVFVAFAGVVRHVKKMARPGHLPLDEENVVIDRGLRGSGCLYREFSRSTVEGRQPNWRPVRSDSSVSGSTSRWHGSTAAPHGG